MSQIPEHSYAIVLGASSGFGRAAALALAEIGYHIVGLHLDRAATLPNAEATRQAIEQMGRRALFFNMNAAEAANRETVIDKLKEEFANYPGAAVRVLVHSLAFGSLRPFISEDHNQMLRQKQLEMTLDVMANSLVYWTQDIFKAGLWGDWGRIFAMTSAGSTRAVPAYGSVSAAKAVLEAYIRQLALELAPYNITANAIRAGVSNTPALQKIPRHELLIQNALMRNPYHRLTTPEDVGKVVALLATPDSYWINGDVIAADGGENIIDLTWWQPNEREQ